MTIRKTFALLAALGAAATFLAIGCATNPVSGRREFSLVSGAQELEIGREGHAAILKEYGAYDDPKLQAFVDSVGQSLAKQSHLPDLEWHFTVLDDPVVNAFALPGGYIYVTRGILAHLNSEAQLAGVLGHEIGHVTARHSAQRLTQQQVAGLGLGIAGVFSEKFRRYGELAQTALGLLFLKYGRDDENQADELGVGYALKAGYDPREIPTTYQTLQRVGARSGQTLPTFLSTHPDPGDRENRTRALATQAAAGKSGLLVRGPVYLRRLDGVVHGQDPRHGFFEGTTFYHPELRFEVRFPEGWKTQNTREAVVAAEPNQRAAMQLTLADGGELSPAGLVSQLQGAGKLGGAEGRTETIGGFSAWAGHVEVAAQSGTAVLAAVFLRRSEDLMFQILGQSATPGDANESRIFTSARSFRALTDPAKLAAKPDRVDVVSVTRSGTFQEILARNRTSLSLDDAVVLNNRDPGEEVRTGELLKLVEPGQR
jgi:predicted Zn-dependent protease